MILNSLFMIKLRQGLIAVAAVLALIGCNEANAENNDNSTKADIQPSQVVVETAEDIKRRCRALSHETEAQKDIKRACYAELKAMRQAETSMLSDKLETEKKSNEEKSVTVEGLTKVLVLQDEQPER